MGATPDRQRALCLDRRVLPFRQVDVFSAEPWLGNPLAVVHDADGLSDEQMARFARWTNLSETTFLCAPTDPARRLPGADLDDGWRAALRGPPHHRQRPRVARGRWRAPR